MRTDKSISACITSPPYATQRALYEGVIESEYPEWTLNWMKKLIPKLVDNGSVLIVIRPHLKDGQISDYVLKTRLALRADNWRECEELIWHKPDGPPLGSTTRPRRTWESILWFSRTSKPFVDLFACGNKNSGRVGAFAGSSRFDNEADNPIHGGQKSEFRKGTSRCSDVFQANVGSIERGVQHPAMFPTSLTDQLVQTFSLEGATVLDPFIGSGQTAISCRKFGRNYVGIDKKKEYADLAQERLKEAEPPKTQEITPQSSAGNQGS